MQEHSTARIPLKARNGTVRAYVLVDAKEHDWLNQWTWRLSAQGYAKASYMNEGRQIHMLMHRLILDTPPDRKTDHISGNRLDNRRCNLRVASDEENGRNVGRHRDNKSGYKGVAWHPASQKWAAYICVSGKRLYLGCFDTPEEASTAYGEAALKHYGDFACWERA